MEINIVDEKKNRLVFELHGEDATFCNILKEELNNDKDVTPVSYRENHPLLKISIITVETKNADPRKSVLEAVKRLKSLNSEFEKELKKKLK